VDTSILFVGTVASGLGLFGEGYLVRSRRPKGLLRAVYLKGVS